MNVRHSNSENKIDALEGSVKNSLKVLRIYSKNDFSISSKNKLGKLATQTNRWQEFFDFVHIAIQKTNNRNIHD